MPSRAWVPATETAGGTNPAGLPELSGTAGAITLVGDSHSTTDVFKKSILATAPNGTNVAWLENGTGYLANLVFRASDKNPIYGGSVTVMPPSIDTPCAIYVGLTI